jgi:hypothetical protein
MSNDTVRAVLLFTARGQFKGHVASRQVIHFHVTVDKRDRDGNVLFYLI